MDFDVSSLLLALLLALLTIKLVQTILDSFKNLPPGPWGLPIVGYLPFTGNPPHIKFQELAKQYGKICSFYLGPHLVVLLNDFNVVKEAFGKQGDNFSGRPRSFPFKVFSFDEGIVTAEGQTYRDYKAFILSTMKDAGAVKASLELIIKDNAEDFVKFVESQGTGPLDVLEPLGLSVAQTYCMLLLGKRCEHDSEWFKSLIGYIYRQQRFYANSPRIYMSWMRKLPILDYFIGETEVRALTLKIYKLLDEIISENEVDYVEGSKKNFIHAWLTEEKKRKEKNPNDKLFDRQHLIFNLNITFGAGYETTTTTILWAFLFLMQNPEVEDKIHDEIDEVIGMDRSPSMADAVHMPYTQAAIFEIHRFSTIGPLGVQHRNKEDAVLCGYHIPKDSYIISNQLCVHMNPDIYPEPEKFKPERFLDENGKYKRREEMLAFSIGKRACPGEPLAQVEIFMYVVYVLQHFNLKPAEGQNLNLERSPSLSSEPGRFKLHFYPRK